MARLHTALGEPAYLALANAEHLGATRRADALGGRLTVFHGYGFGVFHFLFAATLHTICLHLVSPSASVYELE